MPDLTPQELVIRLAHISFGLDNDLNREEMHVLNSAASYLRAFATGEYKQVVHAHWGKGETEGDFLATCSACGYPVSRWHKTSHCPACGALMDEPRDGNSLDGKDDSHE